MMSWLPGLILWPLDLHYGMLPRPVWQESAGQRLNLKLQKIFSNMLTSKGVGLGPKHFYLTS